MIAAFFRDNMLVMLVLYAILFFLMGFAIVLKWNRRSELKLAKSLWLLAGYGFAHGANEIVKIVKRLNEAQLSELMFPAILSTELVFKAVSFMFVFWLGLSLVSEHFKRFRNWQYVGVLLSVSWVGMAVHAFVMRENTLYLGVADNLSRYMFAFPGFLLGACGLWLQVREVEKFGIPALVRSLKGLAVVFLCGSFLVGLVANEPVFWPATVLNKQAFFEFVGVPVIFFRSLFLISLTYYVIRSVDVFEIEREFRLEEALRRQVLLHERERIARELHDGIIQSIYGVGLMLEQALLLADRRVDDSKKQLSYAKNDLNKVIQDIRDYIQELQPDQFYCVSLREGVGELVREFRENVVMQVTLQMDGLQAEELNIIQINNVLQVLRELLTNAAKHSRADQVNVRVDFKTQEIVIHLDDDGIGFNPVLLQHEDKRKQGLKNVFYRVAVLQGTVVFHTAPGHGTHYEITVPYKRLSFAGGMFVDDLRYFRAGAE